MVPRLIAFDLDGTLWRPEMYELWGGGAPFTLDEGNSLHDRKQTKVRLLGETAAILEELRHAPYTDTIVVWVSCTDEPSWAAECLQKFVTSDGVTPLRDVSDSKLNKIFKVCVLPNHLHNCSVHSDCAGNGVGNGMAMVGGDYTCTGH